MESSLMILWKPKMNRVIVVFRKSEANHQDITIKKVKPNGTYYNARGRQLDWKTISYLNGVIEGPFSVGNDTTQFNNGDGCRKDI